MTATNDEPPGNAPDPGKQSDPNSPNGSFPPTHTRLVEIVVGRSQWTTEEQEWLEKNPSWLRYEQEMRVALNQPPSDLAIPESTQHVQQELSRRLALKPPSRN